MTTLSLYVVTFIQSTMANLKNDERGQDLLEYVLLGGLIAVAIIGVGALFGDNLKEMSANIGDCLDFDKSSVCNPGF